MFVIEPAPPGDAEVTEAIGHLLPLLSKSAALPGSAEVDEIAASPATTLFVARDGAGGPIVGTLTLALFRVPSGVRAWIEDVIVSSDVRGRGCGEQLTRAAMDAARAAGARTVDLTSRPAREAANRLYQRMGFQIRDTNVYRFEL
ncbi:MAG: GNAT family N-acetyltransferase [Actinomycetota bacterium]|nr:GNAT family N-acetyltransferase [Actinomycetota bacterium]